MMLIVLVFCSLGGLVSAIPYKVYNIDLAEHYFEEFLMIYEKQYSSEHEKKMRFENFKKNLLKANERNQVDMHAEYGINKFSDLSPEEFKTLNTCFRPAGPNPCTMRSMNFTSLDAPEEWDWRAQGKVTDAKQQGTCGSCWAFSTVGNIESQYAIVHNELRQFSESQLVDCDNNDYGCDGGWPSQAMLYLQSAGGIMSEEDYPYEGAVGQCRFNQQKVQAKVTGCFQFDLASEDELKEALYKTGPLALAVHAEDMQIYNGGILQRCSQGQVDHAVLLVGYGNEGGQPFWLIKNSWGTNYGEDGYVRVPMYKNACSLLNEHIASAVVA